MKRLVAAVCLASLSGIGFQTHTALARTSLIVCLRDGYAQLTTSTDTMPFPNMRACLLYVIRGGTPRPVGNVEIKNALLYAAHIYPLPTGTLTLNGELWFTMLDNYPYKAPAAEPAAGGGTYTTSGGDPSVFGTGGTFTVTGLRQAVYAQSNLLNAPTCQTAPVKLLTLDAQFTPAGGLSPVKTQLQVETVAAPSTSVVRDQTQNSFDASIRADGQYPYYWLISDLTPAPLPDEQIQFTC